MSRAQRAAAKRYRKRVAANERKRERATKAGESKVNYWESFAAPREMFGVFNVEEPYQGTIIAAFGALSEANDFIAACERERDANGDEARHGNADFYAALPLRDVEGALWNSYDAPDFTLEVPE